MYIQYTKPKIGRPKQPVILSEMQKRIVLLLAEGHSMKIIAGLTGKSFYSVNSVLNWLLHKYNVYTKISLIIKLHQIGEIDLNNIQITHKNLNNAA